MEKPYEQKKTCADARPLYWPVRPGAVWQTPPPSPFSVESDPIGSLLTRYTSFTRIISLPVLAPV